MVLILKAYLSRLLIARCMEKLPNASAQGPRPNRDSSCSSETASGPRSGWRRWLGHLKTRLLVIESLPVQNPLSQLIDSLSLRTSEKQSPLLGLSEKMLHSI